jgi:hypothetical protein
MISLIDDRRRATRGRSHAGVEATRKISERPGAFDS